MDVNKDTMMKCLKPLVEDEEKIICPVFGMVRKNVKRMTNATSEYAFITITSKGRLLLYRFDQSTSYTETYNLSTIIFGELHKLQSSGVYAAELSFIDDKGMQKNVYFSVDPTPKGRAFELPNQKKYADKMFAILGKIVP